VLARNAVLGPATAILMTAAVILGAQGLPHTTFVKVAEEPRSVPLAAQIPGSRGYLTTPEELRGIGAKALAGKQPHRDASDQVLTFAGKPDYWPFGSISGPQNPLESKEPGYLGRGDRLVYAKSLAYHLSGDPAYARSVRALVLGLTQSTHWGGEIYSGSNQSILNLSRAIPTWVAAADLIEESDPWSAEDKRQFQRWLAEEAFKKVKWASDHRSTNWGTAGSAAAAFLADYLVGSGMRLVDQNGKLSTPEEAFHEARQRQFDRIRGNDYMYNSVCDDQTVGIRSDGGIPTELGRGSTGCSGLWIADRDASYTYQMSYLEGVTAHAELLLRRGDRGLYDHRAPDGSGSLLRAVHFIIKNPNNPAKSVDWASGRKSQLEPIYRYYQDKSVGKQLGIGSSKRFAGGRSGIMLYWTTLTHGLETDKLPAEPSTGAAPNH
jgi:hypothetical protein